MKFSTLLNEGKKENLISKYGDEPIYKDSDFISKIVEFLNSKIFGKFSYFLFFKTLQYHAYFFNGK